MCLLSVSITTKLESTPLCIVVGLTYGQDWDDADISLPPQYSLEDLVQLELWVNEDALNELIQNLENNARQTTTSNRVILANNGNLQTRQNVITRFTPATPEFFFIRCLCNRYDQPVSHRDIYEYCKSNLGSHHSESAQTYCHKIASNIRKKLPLELRKTLIISSRTKDGLPAYQLTEPK